MVFDPMVDFVNCFFFAFVLFCFWQDPMSLKRVTRVKPIDSFSARWDSIVERVLATPQQPPEPQGNSNGASSNGLASSPQKLLPRPSVTASRECPEQFLTRYKLSRRR